MNESGDDFESDNFAKLLGAFGEHANVERRKRAEKLAALKPSDRRRSGIKRPHQFNVRISDHSQAIVESLCAANKWTQAELIERALARLEEDQKARER